jgi:hypothetical protein
VEGGVRVYFNWLFQYCHFKGIAYGYSKLECTVAARKYKHERIKSALQEKKTSGYQPLKRTFIV